MYIIAVSGFYMEFVKNIAYVLFYVLAYALNSRIQQLTRSIQHKGFSQVDTIKVIGSSREGLSPTEMFRLRDLLLKLLAIHQDFSRASEFLLLVETIASTVITCVSVYLIYSSVRISELLSFHGDMLMCAVLLVKTIDLLILGDCGEVLERSVRNYLKVLLVIVDQFMQSLFLLSRVSD